MTWELKPEIKKEVRKVEIEEKKKNYTSSKEKCKEICT